MLLLMMMMIDSSAINPDSKYRQRLPTRKRFYSPESFHCPSLPTHRHDACENESRVSGSDAATDATVGCSMPLLVLLTHSRTNPSKRSWLSRLSFPVFVSLSLSLLVATVSCCLGCCRCCPGCSAVSWVLVESAFLDFGRIGGQTISRHRPSTSTTTGGQPGTLTGGRMDGNSKKGPGGCCCWC